MSNRERCVAMLDSFTEAQLVNVAAVLQGMKQAIEDALQADTQDSKIRLSSASAAAIQKAQAAFAGAAEDMGVSSEEDVQALVDAVRYGKDR